MSLMPRVLTFAGHCLIALVLTVLAQPAVAEEAQVLLGPNVAHGGFGAVVMGITEVNGETAIMGGVRAAWLIDHRVAIGVGGYGLASRHVGDVPADSLEQHVEMGYGGLEIGYILRPHAVVHGSALLLIGAGGQDTALIGRRTRLALIPTPFSSSSLASTQSSTWRPFSEPPWASVTGSSGMSATHDSTTVISEGSRRPRASSSGSSRGAETAATRGPGCGLWLVGRQLGSARPLLPHATTTVRLKSQDLTPDHRHCAGSGSLLREEGTPFRPHLSPGRDHAVDRGGAPDSRRDELQRVPQGGPRMDVYGHRRWRALEWSPGTRACSASTWRSRRRP